MNYFRNGWFLLWGLLGTAASWLFGGLTEMVGFGLLLLGTVSLAVLVPRNLSSEARHVPKSGVAFLALTLWVLISHFLSWAMGERAEQEICWVCASFIALLFLVVWWAKPASLWLSDRAFALWGWSLVFAWVGVAVAAVFKPQLVPLHGGDALLFLGVVSLLVGLRNVAGRWGMAMATLLTLLCVLLILSPVTGISVTGFPGFLSVVILSVVMVLADRSRFADRSRTKGVVAMSFLGLLCGLSVLQLIRVGSALFIEGVAEFVTGLLQFPMLGAGGGAADLSGFPWFWHLSAAYGFVPCLVLTLAAFWLWGLERVESGFSPISLCWLASLCLALIVPTGPLLWAGWITLGLYAVDVGRRCRSQLKQALPVMGPVSFTDRLLPFTAGLAALYVMAIWLGSVGTYVALSMAFVMSVFCVAGDEPLRGRVVALFSSRCLWVFWGVFLGMCAWFFALPLVHGVEGSVADALEEPKWTGLFLGILIPMVVLLDHGRQAKPVRAALLFAAVALTLLATNAVFQFEKGWNPLRLFLMDRTSASFGGRAQGLLGNPIPFGTVAGAFCLLGIWGLICARQKRWRVALCLGLAVCFVCLLASYSRGPWFALGASVGITFLLVPGRLRAWFGGLAAVFGATLGIALALKPSLWHRLVSSLTTEGHSNEARLQLWEAALRSMQEHPWGVGFDRVKMALEQHLTELGYPLFGTHGHPHNEFFAIGISSGLLGLLLYLGCCAVMFVISVRLMRRAWREGDRWLGFFMGAAVSLQIFLYVCNLTDQMNTPGRFLMNAAWAISAYGAVRQRSCRAATAWP